MKRKNLPAGKHGNSIDILAKCAFCGSGFNRENFTVLEEQEKKTTFHITCAKCRTSSIIFLSVSPGGVVGMGMATDLDQEEAIKMFGQEAISADEVLDAYQFVSKHKGSLAELINKS